MAYLACGNLTIDDVVTADGALTVGHCGGNGLYAALGMWIWEQPTTLLAGVGSDYPEAWLNRLGEAGIDISHLWSTAEPHALRSRAFYRPDGSRTDRAAEFLRASEFGSDLDLSQDYAAFGSEVHTRIWPLYSPSVERLPAGQSWDAVHVGPGPTPAVESLVQTLSSCGTPVLTLDWPWWAADGSLLTDTLARVSAVLPGADELLKFGTGDPDELLRDLNVACPVVVVKQGAAGCLVMTGGRTIRVGTVAVQVADPTGAGDAFCGGFCVGMAQTADPLIAAAYGAVSASFVVETRGALAVLDVDRTQSKARFDDVLQNITEVCAL